MATQPIHPGEILQKDFMEPLGITQYRIAKDMGVTAIRIHQIVHAKRGITVDTAMRLARYFGTDAQSWLNLQSYYDMQIAQRTLAKKIDKEVKIFQWAPV